jgi:hypothetical protein
LAPWAALRPNFLDSPGCQLHYPLQTLPIYFALNLSTWKPRALLVSTVSLSAIIIGFPHLVCAQVSKGQQILLNRGLQIQGLSTPDNYFHLDTYSNANYTSTDWLGESSGNAGFISDFQGPLPGFPWARWVGDENSMPGVGTGLTGNGVPYERSNEIPYLAQLVSAQLGDEWDLNTDSVRTRLVDWFNAVRADWPNTILYHNNWGTQIGDGQLADFYTRAHPDMLCFDTYPWQSVWDGNATDHIGAVIPGPPTGFYGDLRRYREHAKGANIPLAIYRQTFRSVQDYNNTVFRDPSKSELRLNTSAALAFNVKFFSDFTYNPSSGSLFTKTFNGSGDSVLNTNGLYAEMTDVNKRALNLGRALMALKPAYDLHNTNLAYYPNGLPPGPGSTDSNYPTNVYTTSIQFLRGKYISGGVTNFTAVPNSFLPDADVANSNPAGTGQAYTWWESDKNDPYLRGWVVTNKAAIKNNGLLGDGIIAWFKPLDENLDGTAYNNEIYMMVVNALTSPDGTAADCLQQIRLNFLDTTATSKLLMLDPLTGQIVTNALPIVNTRRQLAVDLNGGDAILFKFNTGAPFVGFITPTPAQLTGQDQGTNFVVRMQGALGARYQLQTSPSLSPPSWTTLTNIVLTSSPFVFADAPASSDTARYYRAVGVQ